MRIRLMFEPEPGVNCNVNEMFKCYAENYLSDFPQFGWAGYIVMDNFEKKYGKAEPVYQFLATDVDDNLLEEIKSYVSINPMHGYHTHIHIGLPNENEKAVQY